MDVNDPLYEGTGVPVSALTNAEELSPALFELFTHYADTKAFGARMVSISSVTSWQTDPPDTPWCRCGEVW